MTNTPFSKQVEAVAEFYLNYGYEYPGMLSLYDLGFPLAVAIWQGGVDINSLTDTGKSWITGAFVGICDELGIDIYGDYDSLDNMFELSDEQG